MMEKLVAGWLGLEEWMKKRSIFLVVRHFLALVLVFLRVTRFDSGYVFMRQSWRSSCRVRTWNLDICLRAPASGSSFGRLRSARHGIVLGVISGIISVFLAALFDSGYMNIRQTSWLAEFFCTFLGAGGLRIRGRLCTSKFGHDFHGPCVSGSLLFGVCVS